MAVVSAFLVPGSPLPYLQPDNPPWRPIVSGYEAARKALAASKPDTILLYSTQWLAVLDELWQTRPRATGLHVDENWYEYGDLPFNIRIDTKLAKACVATSATIGVKSKGVNYDNFPIDTGAIVAANILVPNGRIPFVIAANNLYHDWQITMKLGELAAVQARALHRRVAVVGVGGLSASCFRQEINVAKDRVASKKDDQWNRRVLGLMEKGNMRTLLKVCPSYVAQAKVEMGFKHFAWILGALRGKFRGATVHAYGPCYGTGAAVVEFKL